MTLILQQTATAIAPGRSANFAASGGTEPYVLSVLPGGAGGAIDGDGLYTAARSGTYDGEGLFATVQVTDAAAATATARIMVGPPLWLLCEIIQRELGLADGRVYLWDQKIMKPTDNGLYVVVAQAWSKVFANINRHVAGADVLESDQFTIKAVTLDINVVSRGPVARDRYDDAILALRSDYAKQQQEANGFSIARLPIGGRVQNLSTVDGSAIPYRFMFSIVMQYAYYKTSEVDFYDELGSADVITDPEPYS